MGDPVGVGPEIILKALAKREVFEYAKPIVIGNPNVFNIVRDRCDIDVDIVEVSENRIKDLEYRVGKVYIIPIRQPELRNITFGVMSIEAAEAAYNSIVKSIELALSGAIDAVATAPINKVEMRMRYPDFIGHTELFQNMTRSPFVITMFELENMRVFLMTRHVALREVFRYITREAILEAIVNAHRFLEALGINNPTIAVAALNPHASDGGLFGDEEDRIIRPAIEEANRMGIRAIGPIAADAIFWFGRQGRYDAILSLYHDQVHIALKTLDLPGTVGVTLGLPFIRTSPEHGTAYSRAGKCTAIERGMVNSIIIAAKYAYTWKRNWPKIKTYFETK